VRAFLRDIATPAVGLNFDPSHLVRLGVDPIRFLREFAPHVHHVHAKDTLLVPEGAYEYGTLQPAAFAERRRWSGHAWRYVLPGRGITPWPDVFRILSDHGYRGRVSIELEDDDVNGDEIRERRALLESLDYLKKA
jgi:sugar phosphate isomerase/epimerase